MSRTDVGPTLRISVGPKIGIRDSRNEKPRTSFPHFPFFARSPLLSAVWFASAARGTVRLRYGRENETNSRTTRPSRRRSGAQETCAQSFLFSWIVALRLAAHLQFHNTQLRYTPRSNKWVCLRARSATADADRDSRTRYTIRRMLHVLRQ